MIIRGILDRSLSSQLCIRGFAPIKELARISQADYSYQRNPIYKQQEDIRTFLDKEEYLFFPEVILSFKLKTDLSLKGANLTVQPLQELETTRKFTSNVDNSKVRLKPVPYKSAVDIRGKESVELVELELDDTVLLDLIAQNKHPFHRVDGNHRLKAAESSNTSKVKTMIAPFCIILNDYIINEQFDGEKNIKVYDDKNQIFEKIVFHNINTKTIPLTSEENLKVIIDDTDNFPDTFLKEKFGWKFIVIRKIFKDLPENVKDVYPNLGTEFLKNPRTFTEQLITLLLRNKIITKSKKSIANVNQALKDINQLFGNYEFIKNIDGYVLTVASVYLHLTKDYNINIFINWIKNNHIEKLNGLDAESLISIYKKLREAKSKQIFVSMQFCNETKPHYDAIVKAVDEINKEFNNDIKLKEIRIDKFNRGHSYEINDAILELIEESGLLIADISKHNGNVYHELGYLMGLNQGKELKQENFILIKSNEDKFKDNRVGFNITSIQQLRFDNPLQLVEKLKESIITYYNLK
ncbi:MAG: hypothetical protein WCY25_01650 [Moheibacter sp.]